ncbi:MAG: MFS transporter [Burkholderiales bacterium]
MPNLRTIVLCGGLILTLSLGIRHSFGLFLQPMSADLNWGREVFAFAIALQNLVWGIFQPFAGMIADRHGGGRVIAVGSLSYLAGLVLMGLSQSGMALSLSAGLLIGIGLSGTGFSVVYGVIARNVPAENRSFALGLASAAGSFGQFAMLPAIQFSISATGWFLSILILAALAGLIAPLGRALAGNPRHASTQSPRQALAEARAHTGFWLLSFGFFVCGFQIVFIATHLPAYLADLAMPAHVGATALALIGLFNIFGTLACGYLGGRASKKTLLSGLYLLRGFAIAAFVALPASEASVYFFAAVMGLLWLGTVPLTSGIVAQVFGVKFLSMLFGIVFLFHQAGAFFGAWVGGLLFDVTDSYQSVWIIAIVLSGVAAILNWPIDERPLARALPA